MHKSWFQQLINNGKLCLRNLQTPNVIPESRFVQTYIKRIRLHGIEGCRSEQILTGIVIDDTVVVVVVNLGWIASSWNRSFWWWRH